MVWGRLSPVSDGVGFGERIASAQAGGGRVVGNEELLENLKKHFNDSELRDVCLTLKVDYQSLDGSSKADKARELITYLERRNRLTDLLELLPQLRSSVHWGDTEQWPKQKPISNDLNPIQAQEEEDAEQWPKQKPASSSKKPRAFGRTVLVWLAVAISLAAIAIIVFANDSVFGIRSRIFATPTVAFTPTLATTSESKFTPVATTDIVGQATITSTLLATPSQPILFSDNFDEGLNSTIWTQVSGEWVVGKDGRAKSNEPSFSMLKLEKSAPDKYVMNFDFGLEQRSGDLGGAVVFFARREIDSAHIAYLGINLGNPDGIGLLRLVETTELNPQEPKFGPNNPRDLALKHCGNYQFDVRPKNHFYLEVDRLKIVVKVNDSPACENIESDINTGIWSDLSGSVGFHADSRVGFSVDNFVLTPLFGTP